MRIAVRVRTNQRAGKGDVSETMVPPFGRLPERPGGPAHYIINGDI
jgi:hypothetical protein